MPKTISTPELIGFAAIVAVGLAFQYMKTRSNQPTAAEQAWLDSQLATPRSNLTPEEQKWLDKQIQEANDADMLDDARQAGMFTRSLVLLSTCLRSGSFPTDHASAPAIHDFPVLFVTMCALCSLCAGRGQQPAAQKVSHSRAMHACGVTTTTH